MTVAPRSARTAQQLGAATAKSTALAVSWTEVRVPRAGAHVGAAPTDGRELDHLDPRKQRRPGRGFPRHRRSSTMMRAG
eukprot:3634828-Prymnesium_polylepis.3